MSPFVWGLVVGGVVVVFLGLSFAALVIPRRRARARRDVPPREQ